MKLLRYTSHALAVMAERDIEQGWVERTVRAPDWSESDHHDDSAVRLFATVPERGGRVLRVVIVETTAEIRILTAFLDRRARRPE